MRTLRFLLIKEFKQIFRNKSLLALILAMPIIQLLIMPLAADYEVKNINISIVDHDRSSVSRDLMNRITASGYFKLVDYTNSYEVAFGQIEDNTADLILEIPQGFEKNLTREKRQKLFIAVNAINGTKANLGGSYLSTIIQNFNQDIQISSMNAAKSQPIRIQTTASNWYNPTMNYKLFMVPAILVILVTMVGGYMCGLNIVKEKEVGTIEQINVTPIKKYHYILGKLIPFWIIGMFIFSVGFYGVSWLVYGIVPLGSMALLYSFLALFLIALLGFGLLISTYSETQQQAMSIAFFFMMIFILMSGLFTPVESMPDWAKVIAQLNPVTYFINVVRMVVLKGSEFKDVQMNFVAMGLFAIVFNSWAILNYRKTS
jgi:ABC-2 type transport system permease protein